MEQEKRTLQEVLQKEVFTVRDIEVIFSVKQNVAYRIIRNIKAVSDRLELSGRVHRRDYEDYLSRNEKRPSQFSDHTAFPQSAYTNTH